MYRKPGWPGYPSATFCAVAFSLFLLASMSAGAANWRLSPSLEVSETYTNNITLAPTGQEEAEFVTQLNPGFSVSGSGRRLSLSFNYQLQNLFYSRVKGRNNSNHQLLTNFNSELLGDMLYFDGNASYRQMVVDPDGDIGQGNISINGNRQNVATTGLSPYIKRRFGNWSQGELRYTRNTLRYIDGTYEDSVSNAFSGQLASAKRTARWTWNSRFSSRKVKYVTGLRPGETWQNIDFTMRYQFGRKLDLTGTAGYENNEYQRGLGVSAPSGGYWNVGMVWRPTPRTNLVLGRGERFFGNVWNLDLTHRGRRSSVGANYSHDLSSRQQSLFEIPLYDQDGNPILDPDTSEQVTGRIAVDEVYIRQRAVLNAEYRMLRATTTLEFHREFRDYQNSRTKEDITGGSLSWRWRFSRRASLSLNSRLEFRDVIDSYTDNLRASRASLERKLGRRVTAALDARRTQRERSNGNDYTENLLTARLSMRW